VRQADGTVPQFAQVPESDWSTLLQSMRAGPRVQCQILRALNIRLFLRLLNQPVYDGHQLAAAVRHSSLESGQLFS
jgi:hypothetical protein